MMNPVVTRLGLRYINRRLFQSVLFIIGVALGVAVVIAIDLANSSASRAFALSAESITGRATHQVLGGPGGLPTTLYSELRLGLGLRESAPVVTEYLRAPELGQQPLRLLGVDPFAEPPFRSYFNDIDVLGENQDALAALSSFITEPYTVLISSTLASRASIAPGDTITLRPGMEPVPVRVVGLLQPDDAISQQALDDLILTDIATAQEIVGLPGRISRIDLILPAGYDTTQIEALLPPGAVLAAVVSSGDTISQLTAAFEINLQALSLLAVVVGVFLIYNTVSFSVVQRRPVIGIMRALGATRGQIFAFILGESVLLGLAGTLLGVGLGIIFGRAMVGLVSQTISDLYFTVNVQTVTLDPLTLLKGVLLGLLASGVSALVPAYDATRTAPAGTLQRSGLEEQAQRLLPFITLAAAACCAGGLLLLQIPQGGLLLSFTALAAVVVGGALFTPLALVLGMRAAVGPGGRLFGVLGRMAPRAVIRSLSRTSVAVAALTISVSVIVGVSVMIGSFRNTVANWLDTTLGADIYISPPQVTATRSTVDVDPAVLERVRTVPGVAQVSSARSVSAGAPDYPDLPPANLVASDFDISQGLRQFAWNNAPEGDTQAALDAGLVMVSEPFAFRRGITPEANSITLLTAQGPQQFTVFAVYYDYSTDQGSVYMARSSYDAYFDDPFISSIAVFVEPGYALDDVIAELRAVPLAGTDLRAQSNAALRAGVFEVFERTFAITVALRLLATLVAFIGILAALMSLQLEHTREYGVMRATGMTPRQLWNYTLIQTGLMGTVAGLLALPIGVVLALVLVYVINVRSFGWTMQFSATPEAFAEAFVVALAAALLAGLYPAWKLTRLAPARALRGE